jgi:uncharacterized protein YvpB
MVTAFPQKRRWLARAVMVVGLAVAQLSSTTALAFGPGASTWGGGRLDAFVRGTDGGLWHRWRDAGTWHWESLGGTPTSDASAVSWSAGRIDVFVRGFGGTLWHRWLNGSWSGWESLGGQLASEPAAVSIAPGTLDVFVKGTDQALWRARYDPSGWHWTRLGGRLASAPAVTSSGSARIDVFVEGTDLALWHAAVSGATTKWAALGGRLGAAPSAVSSGTGLLDVFVRGADGSLWRDSFNGAWSWQALGGKLTGRPTAAWSGSGAAEGFAVGLDGMLWHWSGGAWEGLGGPVGHTVAVISSAPGTLDVFAQGAANALWHRSRAPGWSAWDNGGGVLLSPSDPILLPVPIYRQDMSLDCETAAMQMALAAWGHYHTQSYLFSFENPDTRPPVMGPNKRVLRWGDPYTNFVGNVNGSDAVPTGYGIYYPPIVSIARAQGAPFASGGEGYAAPTIYEAVAAGHPVMVWVEVGWYRPWLGTWTAWDGRPVRYSLAEHTVVLTGISAGQLRVNDPWKGTVSWVGKSKFETSWADFGNMAVIF